MPKRKKRWSKRPPAISLVALAIMLLFIIRLYQVIDPLVESEVLQKGVYGPLLLDGHLTHLGETMFTSISYLLLSLAGLIILFAFLRMYRWSWVVLMGWTAISLMITLLNFFYGDPNYLVMASDVIIALALNQTEVQRIFGIRIDESEYTEPAIE